MRNFKLLLGGLISIVVILICYSWRVTKTPATSLEVTTVTWKEVDYLVATVEPKDLQFFLENDEQEKFKQFAVLEQYLKGKGQQLLFAMNGGMYLPQKDNEPQGLYIESGKLRQVLETETNVRPIKTNFYLHPNGVFYIDKDREGFVCSNKVFQEQQADKKNYESIFYATQSGPMLVIDEQIHPAFTPNSKNKHIRNGVGILPNGKVTLVLSKKKVCFHDIATLFKDKLFCKNALYLDGYVSQVYYPKIKNYQLSKRGNFGVIMGVTQTNR